MKKTVIILSSLGVVLTFAVSGFSKNEGKTQNRKVAQENSSLTTCYGTSDSKTGSGVYDLETHRVGGNEKDSFYIFSTMHLSASQAKAELENFLSRQKNAEKSKFLGCTTIQLKGD